ncbi:MAG: TIGR03618 family F420-dependent PPOX class oxidoreductase [Acidimicrobiales bacterium]|nr:TIGR03618 family F420-dependent PPOX class oxidoreductase [Acidimicrobiales bacterium]MCB1261122.1 TIGR03618 family F420-dependent PPOX class oxidoreductase [Acidimicrobiales bacterium]
MSRRDLIRMTDEEIEAYLLGRHTMNIATIGPDGSIHLVAMWYGFIGANPAFATYQRSQKVLNVERDARITALVETGETYDELMGVELVGTAKIHTDDAVKRELAKSVATRYFGVEDGPELELAMEPLVNKRVAIEIVPSKVVSWDHHKLGGVY